MIVGVSAKAHVSLRTLSREAATGAKTATKECGLHVQSALGGASSQANVGAAHVKAPQAPAEDKTPSMECGRHAKNN